jgi:hypothetical protein
MPENVTPEILAERVCRRLKLPVADNAEGITNLLRDALTGRFDTAVAAAKVACLTIAEEEAERCRRVGASAAEQIAVKIARRIREPHVE